MTNLPEPAGAGPRTPEGVRIRPAVVTDHEVFLGLFRELGVDDPTPDAARFAREIVPTMLVAERKLAGGVAGYVFFQVIEEVTYIRHVVVAAGARGRGIGRALIDAVAARGRAASCSTWCLNVKPDNASAIALYRACGMEQKHLAQALRLDWSALP